MDDSVDLGILGNDVKYIRKSVDDFKKAVHDDFVITHTKQDQTNGRVKTLELENAERKGEMKAVRQLVTDRIAAEQRRESNYKAPILVSLITTGIGAAATLIITFALKNF